MAGDFNFEPQALPIWQTFALHGCEDLISLREQRYHQPLPPTCVQSTRPDNAFISQQLLPFVGQISVLPDDLFATHAPVMFTLQLPSPQLYTTKLVLPNSWIDWH